MSTGGQRQRSGGGLNTLLGLLIVLLAVGALVILIRLVWTSLTSTDPQLSAAIIGATALVLVAVVGNIVSKQLERRQAVEQDQRNKKAAVYEEFLDYWVPVMRGERSDSEARKKELDERYYGSVPQRLVIWGSEAFIKDSVAHGQKADAAEEGTIFDFEKVMFTVRADLGHSNKNLKRGDLLKLIGLTGVDEHLVDEEEDEI